jgi:ribosomal protein L3 glutamine methyltransferase
VSLPEALQVLTTIRDFVRWGSSEFVRQRLSFGHGFESALDEARYLTLHALALPYDMPDSYLDTVPTLPERERVAELLRLRVEKRQPAAYITRESWFCGLRFYVDERVLVPRSPIAELIANHFEPWTDSPGATHSRSVLRQRLYRYRREVSFHGCRGLRRRYFQRRARGRRDESRRT